MSYLPCVEIEPQQPATHAIIWLHGLGADGNDFAPLVPHLTPAGSGSICISTCATNTSDH